LLFKLRAFKSLLLLTILLLSLSFIIIEKYKNYIFSKLFSDKLSLIYNDEDIISNIHCSLLLIMFLLTSTKYIHYRIRENNLIMIWKEKDIKYTKNKKIIIENIFIKIKSIFKKNKI
jgi:hypothetical protein